MPARLPRAFAIALRIAVIVAAVWAAHVAIGWLDDLAHEMESGGALRAGGIALVLAIYALLIALPFVPGIEIGLTLLMIEGAAIAPFVYLATLAGLGLSFALGAAIPEARLARGLAALGLRRAGELVARLEALSPMRRLALLRARLPGRPGDLMVRRRYLLLALLLNLPGNAVVGGGGGICLTAGASRLFTPGGAALTLALAVAPVPLIVWLAGASALPLFA